MKITTFCPTCRELATTSFERDGEEVVLKPLPSETLIGHGSCDVMALLAALNRAAYHTSKATVYKIKGEE